MNYYGSKELAASFRTVRKNTITIAEEIGEEHYGFRAAPETRTVGQTLTHLALSTRFPLQIHHTEPRSTMEGFDFPAFFAKLMAEDQVQRSKQEILTLLREEGDRFANFLENVSEEFLAERVSFPAIGNTPPKSRFEMLLGSKEHEMHHRAQLMVSERMLGIVPHMTREMQARMAAMLSNKASG